MHVAQIIVQGISDKVTLRACNNSLKAIELLNSMPLGTFSHGVRIVSLDDAEEAFALIDALELNTLTIG